MSNWERKLAQAREVAQAYGRRTQVFGVRGPRGWYYRSAFAPLERQRKPRGGAHPGGLADRVGLEG